MVCGFAKLAEHLGLLMRIGHHENLATSPTVADGSPGRFAKAMLLLRRQGDESARIHAAHARGQ